MSSARRIQASRANGAKSKGPITEAGKRVVSRNAVRHGLLANSILLEGEDADAFLALAQAFDREFQPADEAEHALVDALVVCRWRLMRLWGFEKVKLTDEIANTPPDLPGVRAGRAFCRLAEESRALDLIARYETRFDRQYERALKCLRQRRGSNENANLPNKPSPKNGHLVN